MSKYNTFTVSSFEELCDNVIRIPLKDQKDLAEDILRRLEEDGWDTYWDQANLVATKTEEL
jgi:hypothetical protein